ncbi:MAG: FAD-dependent oxidoreductase [Alphaproteobacteria bacterium]|nr:MAG: FAD-dependent oxidoreductase [Alphaproteobacteria bacterium]
MDARLHCVVVEARSRLGGRAWTFNDRSACPIDLGCGWLHSADRNPWRKLAEVQGRSIDKTPPPWMRLSAPIGFSLSEQAAFLQAHREFYERLDSLLDEKPDIPAATFLEPLGRWNALINAVSTYVSGAELDRVSSRDFLRYDDSGVNWRVVEGYGTVIATHGRDLPVVLGSPVHLIDHSVPKKTQAALGLPLGLADKLFLSLSHAEEFDEEIRLFGRTDHSETGVYHFRPFGRSHIEAYFGGRLASELEARDDVGFVDFAVGELVALLGSNFARRVKPLKLKRWGADPFSRGSYSYALPGKADCRAELAAPVDNRLFFAGEACSRSDYSTAHGAYLSGVAAAEAVIASQKTRR